MDQDTYWADYREVLDPACSPQQLRRLAKSPNHIARELAITNTTCPIDVLVEAALDPDAGVRMAVAKRIDCPPEEVRRLVDDPDPLVHAVAIQHPSAGPV
jgi:radical SAM superfamily enzyme